MHARIEHLLSVRDGEPVDVHVADHIEQCPACSAELRRLSSMRTTLQTLPQFDAPAGSWQQIQLRMPRTSTPRVNRRLGAAAAGALLMVSLIVAVAMRKEDPAEASAKVVVPEDVSAKAPAKAPDKKVVPIVDRPAIPVAELVAQSQHLEQLLQKLPERPRIERVSTAATIDTLEQRVQWLDFQLSYAPDSGLSEEQAGQLWRERVELMDSLVKVRYAEAGRSSF